MRVDLREKRLSRHDEWTAHGHFRTYEVAGRLASIARYPIARARELDDLDHAAGRFTTDSKSTGGQSDEILASIS